MAYSAAAVANAFIQRAIDGKIPDLTPMKLQKLMFYAQSWYLKIYDEELIDDHFRKWQYGPVIQDLYHKLKDYGANIIKKPVSVGVSSFNNAKNGDIIFKIIEPSVPASDEKSWGLIDRIILVYGDYPATRLSAMTHLSGTAWAKTSRMGDVMSNELLKESIGN
ncbi:TPA: SocA family protein [Proteus mirabilis]